MTTDWHIPSVNFKPSLSVNFKPSLSVNFNPGLSHL